MHSLLLSGGSIPSSPVVTGGRPHLRARTAGCAVRTQASSRGEGARRRVRQGWPCAQDAVGDSGADSPGLLAQADDHVRHLQAHRGGRRRGCEWKDWRQSVGCTKELGGTICVSGPLWHCGLSPPGEVRGSELILMRRAATAAIPGPHGVGWWRGPTRASPSRDMTAQSCEQGLCGDTAQLGIPAVPGGDK